MLITGADNMVDFIKKTLGKPSQPTVHQVHAPGDRADLADHGDRHLALNDVVRLAPPGVNLAGYGHYHETYEKTDGQWRIKTSTLTRLREDVFNPPLFFSIRISPRLRDAAAGGLARKRGMV